MEHNETEQNGTEQMTVVQTVMSMEEIKALVASGVRVLNGRGIEFIHEKARYDFGTDGRFDSFTNSCPSLEAAEVAFGYPIRAESDHAFVYTKDSSLEPSPLDGYLLLILGKSLYEVTAQRRVGEELCCGSAEKVEPRLVREYLSGANELLKTDTVFELMMWIKAAQRHGLLDSHYARFQIGYGPGGMQCGTLTAFPVGAKMRGGSCLHPDADARRP